MKPVKEMTDAEVVEALQTPGLLNTVRRAVASGIASIEQAGMQRRPIGAIEIRRREFLLAEKIIQTVKEYKDDDANTNRDGGT